MQPDDLYGLARDRFIPERVALARALRADKRRDEANAVATLRKPSVAAWAVNQLVRSQRKAAGELYAAGDALREAQENLLAGSGDGRTLRAAGERERAAVDALVEAARGLLDTDGRELSASVLERVSDTLHAAALDPAAREQVRPGCLERELRHVGLGLGEPVLTPAAPPPKGAAKLHPKQATKAAAAATPETRAQRGEREREEREQAEAQKRAANERKAARKAARSEETAARRRVERSEAALRAAQERRERAAGALAAADLALAAAQAQAREAAAEHERARAELEHL